MILFKLKYATGLPEGAFLLRSLLYCSVIQYRIEAVSLFWHFSMNRFGVVW